MSLIRPYQKIMKPEVGCELDLSHDMSRDCIAYLLMNENGGLSSFDLSAHNNLGTLSGGVSWAAGPDGPCLSHNGTAGLLFLPDPPAADGGTTLTVVASVYQNALEIDRAIVAKWDYPTQGSWAFQVGSATDATQLRVFIADTLTSSGSSVNDTMTGKWSAGTWHTVGFVFDGSLSSAALRAKIFVDGIDAGAVSTVGTMPTAMQSSTATVKIGYFGGELTRYWNGKVRYVIIYNRAKTTDDMLRIHSDPYANIIQPTRRSYFFVDPGGMGGSLVRQMMAHNHFSGGMAP